MNKIIILFIIAFVMTSTLTGYSMWFRNLEANINISTGNTDPVIGSYKVFISDECIRSHHSGCMYRGIDEDDANISVSKSEFIISLNYRECTTEQNNVSLWIGLVFSNEGTVPIRLVSPSVNIVGEYENAKDEDYYYGPYKTGIGYLPVWGRIDPCDLPLPNSTNNLNIDPDWKGIIWIRIDVTNITGQIIIEIKLQYHLWNEQMS
ncbi:MAG: hypothetical protein J7J82_08090 [Staphylothermus sp.]|nr:hypothetical protein [Staphylothermus sp.]